MYTIVDYLRKKKNIFSCSYGGADEILRAEEKCVKIRPGKAIAHKELSPSLGQLLL